MSDKEDVGLNYYWHAEEFVCHWHYFCHLVPEDVHTNKEWLVTPAQPRRDRCKECETLDRKNNRMLADELLKFLSEGKEG